jgi:MFS family permease
MPVLPSDAAATLRRARIATTVLFALTGAVVAAWSTRLPAIQDRLDLGPGKLGLAILGLEAGAIAGLPAGGALVARIGSPAALRIGFAVYPLGLAAAGVAPGLGALVAAAAAMAAGNSVVDVAVNAQGAELERRCERPVLSRMHAGHGFGLAAGGLVGTAAAAAGVPVAAHFAGAALTGAGAAVLAIRRLVDDRGHVAGARRRFAWPGGALAPLAVVAFCAFLLDGTAYTWIAVHLRTERAAAPGLAAAAFLLYALTVAGGRLAGDGLVTRFGRRSVVRASALLAAAGATLAIAGPGVAAALAGWAVFGLGLAAIAPAVLGAAPNAAPRLPPPVAIAAVTTVGYLGSFTGPPAIGALAGAAELDTALGVAVAVAAAAMVLAARGLTGTCRASGPSPPRG